MSYKIESLKVRNFKCFDSKKFYEFYFIQDANPTILSGPNGFGKTTFFDAIELIFTKRITRLNSEIEDGRTNLGKNILLNTSVECGYLILTLINIRHEKITIVAEIDNRLTKLIIDTAIKFTCIEGTIDTNNFDEFLSGNINWKDDISEFENLNYIKEHFNIYYYVSQAESVHFLKNSISSRKDSMTKLLQTESIQEKIDKIENNLIGATRAKTGVLINDEIKTTKSELDIKISNLKMKLDAAGGEYKEISYTPLLMYPQDCEMKKWDLENLGLKDISEKQLSAYIDEINGIYNLYQDLSDYRKFLKNNETLMFSNNNEAILSYIKFSKFMNGNKFNLKQVEDEITKLNRLLDVFKYSAFFRSELDISKYKKEDMISLQEIGIIPDTLVIGDIDNLVDEIKVLNSKLGKNQKKTNELIQAREKLHSVRENNANLNCCPYCNSPYDNPELLEAAYSSLSTQLKSSQDNNSVEIKGKKAKLSNYAKSIADSIEALFARKDDNEIEQIRTVASEYSMLLKSEKKIGDISKIHGLVGEVNSWRELNETSKIVELKRIIESNISDYENKNFLENLKLYNYDNIFKENACLLSIEQSNLKDKTATDNKIMFVRYQNSLLKNNEIDQIKNDVKTLIIKLKKLEKIRNNFDNLKNLYNTAIDEYKNLVLKKLRVPLLIYTGKILQDYQNGLGVFINKDEMRFVSNGDAKHDILNTFSSGQLAGFVLSFLFAMNKRYISEQTDDIGFILIDDPVQTMDDINIASFIEVLRNDFSNKQIILSTHETDKENYILYKFLKYNLKGQSFNVKDNMY
ncbi:AAA family ATPase [Clostridium amazonitimonense]|uniref:ATP-binding protein n=1 Tax=Clostridium amazonitimonense TaxID=1499689 RepID=UPI0005093F7A|nr:AAA family ATPase [Clostridium amazonitimonense]